MANLNVTHNLGKAKEQNTQNFPNSGPPGKERPETAQLPVTCRQKNKHGVPARLPGGPAPGFPETRSRREKLPEGAEGGERQQRGGQSGI